MTRRRAEPVAGARRGTESHGAAVTAIVVNHNAGEVLRRCIDSLHEEAVEDIVVVDNASADGSLALLDGAVPGIGIVRSPRNLGFGAAVNLGARSARHDILLVCNPDLVLHRGSVGALAGALELHPDAAVVGPRILTPEGDVYPSARTFPSLGDAIGHAFVGLFSEHNRWTERYKMRGTQLETPGTVDWVSGACFAVRREAFSSVGGFDEAYFMYVEDVDLCWRLHRAGWLVVYEPRAVVTHVQGHSTSRRPYRMIAAHHRSMWRFARLSSTGPERAALPAVAAGISARLLLTLAKRLLAQRSAGTPRPPGGGTRR